MKEFRIGLANFLLIITVLTLFIIVNYFISRKKTSSEVLDKTIKTQEDISSSTKQI
jgi:uncharacterized protein YneF (UPF0154 family)